VRRRPLREIGRPPGPEALPRSWWDSRRAPIFAERNYRPWESFNTLLGAALDHLSDRPARQLVEEAGLTDPAGQIGERLGAAFAHVHALERRPSRPLPTTRWVRDYWGVDLVIDVRTVQWGFKPLAPDEKHFGAWYFATLELYDAKRKAVLASVTCGDRPDDRNEGPSWEELVADRGARLERALNRAAAACLDAFARELRVVADGHSLLDRRTAPPPGAPVQGAGRTFDL
jgi:hypothetical protein